MRVARQLLWSALVALTLVGIAAAPAHAQGKAKGHHKHYVVSSDKAVTVTRSVLVRQGYAIVRVERLGATQVVYYRPGKKWRGRGKAPIHRMVIRSVDDHVVFEDTEPSVLVDIDVRLKL